MSDDVHGVVFGEVRRNVEALADVVSATTAGVMEEGEWLRQRTDNPDAFLVEFAAREGAATVDAVHRLQRHLADLNGALAIFAHRLAAIPVPPPPREPGHN